MNTEKKYIKVENLRHGYVYRIKARNSKYGVWNEEKGEFLISRFKFYDNFTFLEAYWNMKGDVILPDAIKELEKCPYDVNDYDEKSMLTYLNEFDTIKCSECGRDGYAGIKHEIWCSKDDKPVKCPCGGYMNDWHSHASDCIVINSKYGRKY